MACIKRFSKVLINAMYLTILLFSVLFTFLAIVYDKQGFSRDFITYAIIYGLVLAPPAVLIAITSFSVNKHNEKAVSFGDAVLITVCAVVLLVLGALGSRHDIKFMIPWCLMLLIDVAFIIIRKSGKNKARTS